VNARPILTVGSIALDTIETPQGQRREILGGSATFFAVAAALFAPVRLVGVVGSDYPEEGWRLFRERGVDVSDVQQIAGSTFRWGGHYSRDLSGRETLFTHLGVFEDFQPLVSDENRLTEIIYLGNIQPSLQLAVCEHMTAARRIISDTMNLWIDMNREELEAVLEKTHIFLINDEEAAQLTGHDDLESAARWLLKAGPSTVVIKLGHRGAFLATNGARKHIPVYPHARLVDPTGAGDSFAGGFIGHIANHDESQLEEAVIRGTATASFTVEGFGLEGLLRATPEGIEHRMETIRSLID